MSHAPSDYDCPFCKIVGGLDIVENRSADVVLQNSAITAFVSLHQWSANKGHVLIVPNEHFENLYELPVKYAEPIQEASKTIAHALKCAFVCPGTSTRQHNEPAGNQDVWHFHLHVFPRYHQDNLYGSKPTLVSADERAEQAKKLREAISNLQSGV